MTRDEIRGLMGGYATGSLTAAERQILFAAALEDQDLFDELAREQALKEVLDEPGARARLLAALPRPTLVPQPWWRTTWAWGAAAAACVALIAGIVLLHSSARVEQVARLETPELPGPPAPEPAPVPPSVALPAPKAAAPAPAAKPTPAGASEVKPAAPEVRQGVKQEVQREAKQEAPAAAAPAAADAFGVNGGVVAGVAPPGIPPAPPFAPQAFAQGNTALGTGTLAAPIQPAPAPAQAGGRGGRGGGGGGRGGGRGGGGGSRALAQPQAAQSPRFSFDYTVTQQFVLRISPAANGFLTVNVTKASSSAPLISARPIQAGAVTEVQLPDDSVSVTVVFSAQERPTGLASVITGATEPLSGTKSDPNPSPNSVLYVLIPLKGVPR